MRYLLRRVFAVVVTFVVLGSLPMPASAAKYYFGQGPFMDIMSAAEDALQGYQGYPLSHAKLMALMMSVTWKESGASTNDLSPGAPSPMVMGRNDNTLYDTWLWENTNKSTPDRSTPYPRAYFHAGVGIFQLDSGGIGKSYSAIDAIDTYAAATVAAATIRDAWDISSAGTDEAQRRNDSWWAWNACQTSTACDDAFKAIYDSANDALRLDHMDPDVDSFGGAVWRTCSYSSYPTGTFDCLFVDASNAQGDTTYWTRSPDGSRVVGGTSPLFKPSYLVKRTNTEERHFLKSDTNYAENVWVYRWYFNNPRSRLDWSRSRVLCVSGVCQ